LIAAGLANVLLHVLEPELSVVDNVMSEYALGGHGWLSRAGDFSNAVGVVAIAGAMRSRSARYRRLRMAEGNPCRRVSYAIGSVYDDDQLQSRRR
jgi:hypothetical protein